MIYFNFKIINPFKSKQEPRDFFLWCKRVTKIRNLEIQVSRFNMFNLFDFELDTRFKGQDHQGPSLEIEILGYFFSIKLYSIYHWDAKKNDWDYNEDWSDYTSYQ